ncbi:MAG: hypothetical protein ACT4OX_14920 [Actinomycetota bacterium]
MIDQAVTELAPLVGVRAGCAALGEAPARWYRRHRQSPPPQRTERLPVPQPRALSEIERKEVLRVLHEPDHVDEAPATVYAKLLDDGIYIASVSTMYRILRAVDEVRERRRHATHPAHKKPELIATGLPRLRLTVVVSDHAASSSSRQGGRVMASSYSTGVSLPSAR